MRRLALPIALLLALILLLIGGAALVRERAAPEETQRDEAMGRAGGAEAPRERRRTRAADARPSPASASASASASSEVPSAEVPEEVRDDLSRLGRESDVLGDPIRESARPVNHSIGIGGKVSGSRRGDARPIHAVGRVIDDQTGDPIGGAALRISVPRRVGPWGVALLRDASAADGTFDVRTRGVAAEKRRRAVLTVRAPGHHPWRGPVRDSAMTVELTPRTATDRSGTVAGGAADERGRALYGPLLVALRSEYGDAENQWVLADAQGRLRVEGLEPGRWWLRITDRTQPPWVAVDVAAGVESSAEFTATLLTKPPAFGGFGPRRDVVVRGLPDSVHEGAVVRAEGSGSVFWRTTVHGREARFTLPVGSWRIVAAGTGGGGGAERQVRVVLAAEPLVVTLSDE